MKIETTAQVDGGVGENADMTVEREWSAIATAGDGVPVLGSGHDAWVLSQIGD